MEQPFLEHPTGEHETALEAMEHAVRRLRALPEWKQWITFCAQGAGESDESIHCAELRLLGDTLDTGGSVNVTTITTLAKVNGKCLVPAGPLYSIAAATPEEAARVLDALFRHHLDIRSFADEDDYAIGAEWLDPTATPSPGSE